MQCSAVHRPAPPYRGMRGASAVETAEWVAVCSDPYSGGAVQCSGACAVCSDLGGSGWTGAGGGTERGEV